MPSSTYIPACYSSGTGSTGKHASNTAILAVEANDIKW